MYTQSHTPTVAYKGGGVLTDPPWVFDMLQYFEIKRFCLQWRAFDLLYKIRYFLWVVALLEVCDVTKHGRHLQILSRIRNQVIKTERINNFLPLTCKITHPQVLLLLLKKVENMYFHSKIAWPPHTYDVISRNHSNCPSLKLFRNAREG